MLSAAERALSMAPGAKRNRRERPVAFYFAGFSSFHGSLTIGIVAISTLASLPSTFSTRRI